MKTFNTKGNIEQVIKEIKLHADENTAAICFMASTHYDFKLLDQKINEAFNEDIIIIGCTTSGELTSKGLVNNSVSFVIFEKRIGRMKGVLINEISSIPMIDYRKVKNTILETGINIENPHGICVSFSTGLSSGEEKVLSVLDSIFLNKKLPLIGGSAGDDLKFKETFVSLNGVVNNDATVCLFINSNEFKIYKENIFIETGRRMQVTKSSVKKRTVYEFDHKKASTRYSELLGINERTLSDYFGKNPLGQVQGDQVYIRSPYAINDDKSITFYSQLHEGIVVDILELTNPITQIENTMKKVKSDFSKIDGIVGINCILRTLQFKNDKIDQEFCNVISKTCSNVVGFSSYGEQLGNEYGFLHLNQTLTMLVHGKK